jgi:hypothetical protein
MKIIKNLIILIIVFAASQSQLAAQDKYNDYKSMAGKIQSLSGDYPQVCSVRSLAKTAGGKEIWVLSIGSGNKENKPGIAILGGVGGNYILGREPHGSGFRAGEISVEIKELLDKNYLHVFPDVA